MKLHQAQLNEDLRKKLVNIILNKLTLYGGNYIIIYLYLFNINRYFLTIFKLFWKLLVATVSGESLETRLRIGSSDMLFSKNC